MSRSQDWWDDFWAGQTPLAGSDCARPDTWYDLVWNFAFTYWKDVFEKHAPGRSMLECGCGSARISQYMAQHGYRCTLLDYSARALNLAKANFGSLSLDGQFLIGDINHLCFRDEQFDVVYSGGVLEFFTDVEKPIREMVRVLKPGGILAANMVPRKFSIQTIADIERTVAYSARNLINRRFRDFFRRVHHIPEDYQVNSLTLNQYIRCCENAGLTSVYGRVTSPFPALALPGFGKRFYAHVMKMMLPQWKRFNQSKSPWTEIWGVAYTLHGLKK